MKFEAGSFDAAVIGAGHAGIEAGLACARLGLHTAVFTINLDAVGNMPCNPAIGGTGKGHLVRELDALGGEMAKAADRYDERFMVYVTTKTEAPGVNDFVRIDPGNYESVDYKGWKEFSYDLTEYTGTPIRFAIRYVGCANTYGAFMLMIDDVFVGQPAANTAQLNDTALTFWRFAPDGQPAPYRMYTDDGVTTDHNKPEHWRIVGQ